MVDSRFARCLQGGGVSVLGGLVTISSCTINGNTADIVRALTLLKVPIAPMLDSRFARCLQGGGFYDWDGTVSIVNSQIYSNTAPDVRTFRYFPSPPWGE
jgi:hypothetical protein